MVGEQCAFLKVGKSWIKKALDARNRANLFRKLIVLASAATSACPTQTGGTQVPYDSTADKTLYCARVL